MKNQYPPRKDYKPDKNQLSLWAKNLKPGQEKSKARESHVFESRYFRSWPEFRGKSKSRKHDWASIHFTSRLLPECWQWKTRQPHADDPFCLEQKHAKNLLSKRPWINFLLAWFATNTHKLHKIFKECLLVFVANHAVFYLIKKTVLLGRGNLAQTVLHLALGTSLGLLAKLIAQRPRV